MCFVLSVYNVDLDCRMSMLQSHDMVRPGLWYMYMLSIKGLTLNKLRKHSDEEISTKANKIYRSWKQHFKDKLDKPKIEVRFDHATNKYRSSSRKLLEARLHPHKV